MLAVVSMALVSCGKKVGIADPAITYSTPNVNPEAVLDIRDCYQVKSVSLSPNTAYSKTRFNASVTLEVIKEMPAEMEAGSCMISLCNADMAVFESSEPLELNPMKKGDVCTINWEWFNKDTEKDVRFIQITGMGAWKKVVVETMSFRRQMIDDMMKNGFNKEAIMQELGISEEELMKELGL